MSSSSRPSTSAANGKEDAKSPSKAAPKSDFELDVSKLHSLSSEQQELYLFNFVTSLEKHILELKPASLKEEQSQLKKELVQTIHLRSPAPSRVVRNTIGRCFRAIFDRGDRKLLFESITELGELIGAGKADKDTRAKHAAAHCLGEIYKAAGDGAINLTAIICPALTKLYKNASNHVALRAAAFKALGKIVASVGGSMDENIARDVWKQSRNAASGDRGALVQINACWCLEQFIRHTPFFDNTNDFDSLKSTIWKTADSSFVAARHAAASCLAAIMVKNFTERNTSKAKAKAPKIKKPKRTGTAQELTEQDIEELEAARSASPTPKKNALVLELPISEILQQLLGQYVRNSTSNRTRAAIITCYMKVFQTLDLRVVEKSFGLISDHFLIDMLNSPAISNHRYRILLTRRFVQKLLGDLIGRQILGESAQLDAAKTIISDTLKNYPRVLAEKSEPTKNTLTGTLGVLGTFIQSLGSAFSPMADSCRDALIQILQHPSYTVQIHASYCLRLFALACPQQLIQCASICMNSVTRELGLLATERWSARKSLGYANGLSAVLSISSLQPLYSSLEISSRVLQQATGLLKSSASEELRVSGIQVQVAWVLIGGLMSIGPNFVKIHLNQLLLLWRNALPRPLTKENAAQRRAEELSYLALVRECALGSILSFLEFNNRLLTTDVSKRIAALLENTTEFLDSLPPMRYDNEVSPRITASLQLADLVQMVRRRVLQCFARLATQSPHTSSEILSDSKLLTFAASCFAEPENYPQSSLGTSIANSSANFESIWNVADNSGFGVSGLMRGLQVKPLSGEKSSGTGSYWQELLEPSDAIDSLLLSPVCGAIEHDSIYISQAGTPNDGREENPDPPATEVVNSAITLFAIALPLQPPKVQESTLEHLSTYLSAKSLQRDPGRRAAIVINICLALLGALKVSSGELTASAGDLKSTPVARCIDDLLRMFITSNDQYVRNAAYEAIGRLCSNAGNTFTEGVVNGLVDTIVSNREPSARAGCAMALASIHSNVGGIAANFHLRKIHGVLMSLCSDPHPTVHFWAIEAMSKVAESASLDFASYMPSTLGLLAQMWISDSHSQEANSVGTSNSELEMPTPAAIAHSIASLINVLGPDLQDMTKARDLILNLVSQFDIDDSGMVQTQALNCWENVYLYAPSKVDLRKYVRQLQQGLSKNEHGLHATAIDGLHNLMKRDAQSVLEVADEGLEDQIWTSLDKPGSQNGIRGIIEVWLEQTALNRTGEWISRCQELLTKTVARQIEVPTQETKGDQSAAPNMQDEEVAGFNVSDEKGENGAAKPAGQELLRWQVRELALQSLSDVFSMCAKDAQMHPNSTAGQLLQNRVADIIRLAFLASTTSVVELRIGGLRLIDQVLTAFGRTPDPDFSEALLLEQYQAQISSALTPAFGADSSPELASAAISVCGTFIATGLVTDVDRMGRILKLLVSSLQSFTAETGDPTIGDLKGLSSNAQRMVKMAVLSAWAELQVASTEQAYLNDVVKPHVASLTPMWLESLQDFAKLRFEPDISNSMGVSPDDPLDTVYAALNRETLLNFYQDSWLTLVDAIASLIDQDSEFVFDALDRKKSGEEAGSKNLHIDYRNEPVAFFFILYGIAFEALVTDSQSQTLEILEALKKILRPSVSGAAIYQDVVFTETMELFDRLAQTEGLAVQGAIVDITRNLCLTHPTVGREANNEQISDDIEQLFELTRIIVLVLAGVVPNLGDNPSSARQSLTDEAVSLVTLALDALVDASDVFPSVIKTDLHACIIHIFTTILGTGVCQAQVVPKALPIFKRFLQTVTKSTSDLNPQLRICLLRFRSILGHAQRRETEASLPCARNTLLASVILLGTGSQAIAFDDPLIAPLLDDILQCFSNRGLGKVAANCARSMLLTEPKSATSQAVARHVLPQTTTYILDTSQNDPEGARLLLIYTLAAYVGSLKEDVDAFMVALCVVLPVLLQYASVTGKESYSDVAGRLLFIAGVNQSGFKGVVGTMSAEQRSRMEEIIRESGAGRKEEKEERGEPSIALKFNFGGK